MKSTPVTVALLGPVSPPVTGPGVKNRALLNALTEHGFGVLVVNTLGWKRKPVSTFVEVFRAGRDADAVVISASANGRMVLLGLLWVASLVPALSKPAILLAAGGSLAAELDSLPGLLRRAYRALLEKCHIVYVETTILRDALMQRRVHNARLLRNPRRRPRERWQPTSGLTRSGHDLLFLSKVREGKGVLVLLNTIDRLRSEGKNVRLTIAGPVSPGFEQAFRSAIEGRGYVEYLGSVPPDAVPGLMATHDMFVFPTLLPEGLPGVIVEAALVGVPVISSRFAAAEEVLSHERSALLLDEVSTDSLTEAIRRLLDDPQLSTQLSRGIRDVAEEFEIESALEPLVVELNQLMDHRIIE